MKFPSGKRIGQSGQQLTTAVLFSFFLHAILLLTVLFFHFAIWPRIDLPPFYAVKLVGLPPDGAASVQTPGQTPPALEKQQAKPAPAKPKARKRADPSPKTARKNALPDLAPSSKKRTAEAEQEKPEAQPAASASLSDQRAAGVGSKGEKVTVAAQQSDFKFGYYLERVRSKIGQNWNPPPDAPDARVRVIFSVNRSGWVGEITMDEKESSGSFQFRQAAMRAIRASNPFPELPEEFSRQKLDFSVDLTAVE